MPNQTANITEHTEQVASANCNASNDSKTIKYEICEDSGFMRVSGVCARSGIQEYLGYEIGLSGDDANKVFNVLRPKDEVLASLSSYNGAIVTDNHPLDGIVTTDSYKELSRGNASEATSFIKDNEMYVVAKATITSQDTIQSVIDGKRELSGGYTRDLVKESGVYNGESYDYVQRNMRVNHVAIVDEGRCGNACKLNLDKKGVTNNMVNIQIDGRSVSMDEKEVCKYVGDLKSSNDTLAKELKVSNDMAEETKKELDAEVSSKEELIKQIADMSAKLSEMMTMEEAEGMAEESGMITEDADALDIETKEKSNDGKMKEILGAISDSKHSFDSMDKETLRTVYRISVDQAIKAKKIQKDGYNGDSAKQPFQRTGNLTNDLNTIAANARKERGAK